jgi:hypothetical protein
MAWPLCGAKRRHTETLLGCVTFTERGAKQMKSLDSGRYVLTSCVAVAMLAGCGGSQPPIGATAAAPQRSAIATRADRGRSWMLPEATSEDLLYVTTLAGVKIYSYPGGKHVGTLGAFAYDNGGICADKTGDVFIPDGKALFEYKHGGKKPMATLTQSGYYAFDCASDPTSGNLAVTWAVTQGTKFVGNLAVYQNPSGTPTIYSLSGMAPETCSYDKKSNLFCNGSTNYGDEFLFAELPKGGTALESVSLNHSFGYCCGGVQWDGKYVTVTSGDPSDNNVYGFTISGSSGTLKRTVALVEDPSEYLPSGTFIIGNRVIEANIALDNNHPYGEVNYYDYTKGGSSTKDISIGLDTAPNGVTVSLAPSRS